MAKRSLIGQIRGILYPLAKGLGDVGAVERAAKSGSAVPLIKRAARRIAGKSTGRGLGKLFK